MNTTTDYVDLYSAEMMHKASRNWLSELQFITDEQHFFDELIRSFTLQLIDSKYFEESKVLIDTLSGLRTRTDQLIKTVRSHENELEIMVDDIDEPEKEEAYRQEHRQLIIGISEFEKTYKAFKTRFFDLIKSILKVQKQGRLLE